MSVQQGFVIVWLACFSACASNDNASPTPCATDAGPDDGSDAASPSSDAASSSSDAARSSSDAGDAETSDADRSPVTACTGAGVRTLISDTTPIAPVVLSGDRVVYAQKFTGIVASVPRAGGTPTVSASFPVNGSVPGFRIAVTTDDHFAYWSHLQRAGMFRTWLDFKGLTSIYPDFGAGPIVAASVDATRMYVAHNENVLAVALDGADAPSQIAAATILVGSTAVKLPIAYLASDEEAVFYWAGGSGSVAGVPFSMGNVVRVQKGGLASVILAATGASVTGFAVDATNVYWLDAASGGSVQTVAKRGGGSVVLQTNQPSSTSLAVDSTKIYWSTASAVFTAPKVPNATVTTLAT